MQDWSATMQSTSSSRATPQTQQIRPTPQRWSPESPHRVVIPIVATHRHVALNYIVAISFGAFAVAAGVVTLVLQRSPKEQTLE